jgi:serine/threonine protein kinase
VAPEVIELKGASTASDIWSLACTIIELVTGKPPYGDLIAMSAMFRIVEEERPPIPSRCSPELRDFLSLCFRKDPVQRPTAVQLFGHEWLKKNWDPHKDLRPQDSVPFLRRISAGDPRRLDMDTNFSPSTPSMDRSASSPGTSSSPLSSMPNSPRLGGQDFVRIVSSDGDQRRAFGMAEMEYGPPKEGDLERLRTPPLPELAVSLPSAYVSLFAP